MITRSEMISLLNKNKKNLYNQFNHAERVMWLYEVSHFNTTAIYPTLKDCDRIVSEWEDNE